jgi:hypothetical protein
MAAGKRTSFVSDRLILKLQISIGLGKQRVQVFAFWVDV